MIFAVVFLHVAALHVSGSNNPLGIDVKTPKDTVPFHPYYTAKDGFGLAGVSHQFYLTSDRVLCAQRALGDPDNYIMANPMVTPAHIVPEWYFLPFYAILRSFVWDIHFPFTHLVLISSKLGGVILMFGAVLLLFVLPWLDPSPVRSAMSPAAVPYLLLDISCGLHGLDLGWGAAAGRLAGSSRAGLHSVLFRVLPCYPAAAAEIRKDFAAAEKHFGSRAQERLIG